MTVGPIRWFPPNLTFRTLTNPVYFCEFCGCIFLPQYETDGVYPDRFQVANAADSTYPTDGCDIDCDCHDLPGYIPANDNTNALEEDLPDE